MTFIPRFVNSSTPYSITLTPGVLSASVALSPTVTYNYARPILYSIVTDSTGDGVGASDMAAEGYVDIDAGGTLATAHRSIDNHGCNTTFYFFVVDFRPSMFRQVFGSGSTGPRAFPLPTGKSEPAGTNVLPTNYQTGWQYTILDPK